MQRLAFFVFVAVVPACGARTGLRTRGVRDATTFVDAADAHTFIDATDRAVFDRIAPSDESEARDRAVVPDVADTHVVPPIDGSIAAACARSLDAGGALAPPVCTAMLSVGSLTRSDPICFVDQMVENASATLRYECGGGLAEATFGMEHFVGTVVDGQVSLCVETRFHWSDGCDWSSAQEITGTLASGALEFVYSEAPLPGQTGCFFACTATGAVRVQ